MKYTAVGVKDWLEHLNTIGQETTFQLLAMTNGNRLKRALDFRKLVPGKQVLHNL